jgi:hypothetical protein
MGKHFVNAGEILLDQREDIGEFRNIGRELFAQVRNRDAVAGARIDPLCFVGQIENPPSSELRSGVADFSESTTHRNRTSPLPAE